jgi:hypothetical protein
MLLMGKRIVTRDDGPHFTPQSGEARGFRNRWLGLKTSSRTH